MSKRDERPIEVGDRFETRDRRDEGRVVEVVVAHPDERFSDRHYRALRNAAAWGMTVEEVEQWLREGEVRFNIRTEAHPRNPDAIGNVSRISERTLRTKYKRVSR